MPQIGRTNWQIRRAILPAAVFVTVLATHYLWLGLFPEQDPAQVRWAVIPEEASWFNKYVEAKNYWLGYAYGLSLAFAAVALRSYSQTRCTASRNLACGGVTFSGLLVAVGCFLIGCCGSPMLVVWLNIFGVSFIPLAKPLIALLTTVVIGGAWWWMRRRMVMIT
jgi:hypothetical protein